MPKTLIWGIGRTLLLFMAALIVVSCGFTTVMKGLPLGVHYTVTPVYPSSYDITVTTEQNLSPETLKEAWMKKAAELAKGRKFKTSPLTSRVREHAVENPYVPAMTETRTVTGTVSIQP
jgi:hypothetical protein